MVLSHVSEGRIVPPEGDGSMTVPELEVKVPLPHTLCTSDLNAHVAAHVGDTVFGFTEKLSVTEC